MIELLPPAVDFHVEPVAQPDRDFWGGFWDYLWNRPLAQTRDVPLRLGYDVDSLRVYLADIAARYDFEPGQADFSLVTLTIEQGRSGTHLEMDQAARLIDAALRQPDAAQRQVVLPVSDVLPAEQVLPTLQERIQSLIVAHDFAKNPDRLASVYVMDLGTGQEVSILADVPHSAVSTIKIPIMINVFRANADTPAPDIAYLLTESLLCSNNNASNLLIESTGAFGTDKAMMLDGLNQVSCLVQRLGAEHTFIDAPLEVGDPTLHYTAAVCLPDTPANTAYNTNPDLNAQTTAQDIGLLLTEINDCANSWQRLAGR